MPVVVGLTGGIGSGKSSVAAEWLRLGAAVIDADAEARAVLAPGTVGLWLVKHRFGAGVIDSDGSLDRAALAQVVFSDANARKALNARTHPLIISRMVFRLLWAVLVDLRSVIVLDTPLLYETRFLLPFCGKVVVVYCNEEQQVSRAAARAGISPDDIIRRMQAQISLEQKREWADVVVDNTGEKDVLGQIAAEALQKLKPRPVTHIVFCSVVVSVWVYFGYRFCLSVSKTVIGNDAGT